MSSSLFSSLWYHVGFEATNNSSANGWKVRSAATLPPLHTMLPLLRYSHKKNSAISIQAAEGHVLEWRIWTRRISECQVTWLVGSGLEGYWRNFNRQMPFKNALFNILQRFLRTLSFYCIDIWHLLLAKTLYESSLPFTLICTVARTNNNPWVNLRKTDQYTHMLDFT